MPLFTLLMFSIVYDGQKALLFLLLCVCVGGEVGRYLPASL